MARLIDLSHPIEAGMVTHPGLPGPEISDHLSRARSRANYAEGTEFQIGRISMVANTGTYLDAPFHRYEGAPDLSQLPLEKLAHLDALTVRGTALDQERIAGRAVLFHTGWDRNWGKPEYGIGAPFLTSETAQWLVENKAALVGIDSVNIDDLKDKARPVHSLLLAAGIPIVEHLRGLEQLPASGFRFSAVPPMVRGMGTFPVRAFAVIED